MFRFSLWVPKFLVFSGVFCATVTAKPLVFTVRPDSLGRTISPDFLGLSIEASRMGSIEEFDSRDSAHLMLLRQIGPGVFRIGGASVDRDTQPFDTLPYYKTYDFIRRSGWKVIMGLGLGQFDIPKATRIAEYSMNRFSDRVLAFEIGNEPDLFWKNGLRSPDPKWWEADYEKEFSAYVQGIRAKVPGAAFCGPGDAIKSLSGWTLPFANHQASKISLVTSHYYPYGPLGDSVFIMDTLLSPSGHRKFEGYVNELAQGLAGLNLPARLDEINSVYRGGEPGASDVFGSALWGSDLLFTAAKAGIAGICFHGGGKALYGPIWVTKTESTARPLYYGMMLFKYAGSGRFVGGGLDDPKANLLSWAVKGSGDSLRVVLLNKDKTTPYEVTIAGTGRTSAGRLIRLSAPSLFARTGLTLGGDSISNSRPWAPKKIETVPYTAAGYAVSVPPGSAAVLTLSSQSTSRRSAPVLAQTPLPARYEGGFLMVRAEPYHPVRISLHTLRGKLLGEIALTDGTGDIRVDLQPLLSQKDGAAILTLRSANTEARQWLVP